MPVLSDYMLSPTWWITSVGFALLLNILSAFAVRAIDRWGGQISTRWSTRTAAKRRRRAQLIAAVRADVDRLIWVGFQAQSMKTTSFLFFGFGFALLALAMIWPDEVTRLLLSFMGVLALGLGMFFGSRAADLEAVIRAVEPKWPKLPSDESEGTMR